LCDPVAESIQLAVYMDAITRSIATNATSALRIASTQFLASASPLGLARAIASTIPAAEHIAWGRSEPVQPAAIAPLPATMAAASQATATGVADTRTLALLSADVYQASASPPAGYRVASATDLGALGLKPSDLTSTQSSFVARVYVTGSGANTAYVVAFRGSTSNRSDWISNLRQGVGASSDHYNRALYIGAQLARSGARNVQLTGHSLGGGLASAAAIASGRPAQTFNAAGLSDTTIRTANQARTAQGIAHAGAVSAFYIRGEILSAIQDGGDRVLGALFGGIAGAAVADAPEAYGTRIALDAVRPGGVRWYQDNPVARHGIDWVIASLNR
jgi:Protein of unknown function (DUF2974)